MMKRMLIALAVICAAACAFAQDSSLKVGSVAAARWDDGDSSILERSAIKPISPNPKVSKGQKVFATDVADLSAGSAASASAAKSFVLWHKGSRVGEIGADGRVWKNGSMVGEAPGLKLPWAAAVCFFFFIDE